MAKDEIKIKSNGLRNELKEDTEKYRQTNKRLD